MAAIEATMDSVSPHFVAMPKIARSIVSATVVAFTGTTR